MNGVAIRCVPTGNDDDDGDEYELSLGDAVVAMGSPPANESMAMSLRALPVLMPRVRTIRMLGSAAIMLAWVANGRLSAYWEYDLR
jgi:myo-inositol-1(or 4)-monophosphatase